MNTRWLAYALPLLAWISFGYACKGGDGGAGEFLTVLITAPEDGRSDVQVDAQIGFQIDAPIDPATLTNATFFVTDAEGTRVEGALAIGDEPEIAVLTPAQPLAVISEFTATITTGLSSEGGATLEQDFNWTFTTLDSAWGVSERIEEIGTGDPSKQQIVVDGQSNALAVWEYAEPTGKSIWANRYTRVDLWGTPEPIDAGSGGATDPQVAADAAGNGFAVWRDSEDGGLTGNIWTNRYLVDEGWGTAELLQNGEVTPARAPAIAADPAGNATAIWIQRDMLTSEELPWSSRYVPGTGWGAAAPIDDMPAGLLGLTTAVGVDSDGNATAIWTRPAPLGAGRSVIWANRYTPGSGWGTSELIKTDENTNAEGVRLDVGASGDAFVTWVQQGETRQDVWSNRFSGSTWGAAERIDGYDAGDTVEADIAVDGGTGIAGTGIAHAVWSQSDPDFQNIWASQYTPGSGWGGPELIEPPNEDPLNDSDAVSPRVEVNTAGNAFVVFQQRSDGWRSIWSNRLDPGTGWVAAQAEVIEDEPRTASKPLIVVDENRHAHALWLQSINNTVDSVRTNRFE